MAHESRAITDRKRVETLAEEYLEFLPGARELPPAGRLALAHISLAHGFDPFLKECWAIPAKDRNTRQVIGFELMIGITGWRRTAHESGEYWGRRFEKVTDEERLWLRVGPDDLAIKCVVMRRKTGQQPMEFDGFGIFRKGELSKMNPLHCVRLRAERDALKAAFPISLAGAFGARVRVVDEDTGEIINGEYSVGGTGTSLDSVPDPHEPLDTGVDVPAPDYEFVPVDDVQGSESTPKFGSGAGTAGDVPDPQPPTPPDGAGGTGDFDPAQLPTNKREFERWVMGHGWTGGDVRAALGTALGDWLKVNVGRSVEDAAKEMRAVLTSQ